MKKPKLLILGYARHGKDTVAEILQQNHGYQFESSSHLIGRLAVWEHWGCAVYDTFEEMYEDRVNHRVLWMQMISAFNTPDKTKTSSTMIEAGADMYVGMRRLDELEACKKAGIFDHIIWVDREMLLPPETGSMDITRENCGYNVLIDNNGSLEDLVKNVDLVAQSFT